MYNILKLFIILILCTFIVIYLSWYYAIKEKVVIRHVKHEIDQDVNLMDKKYKNEEVEYKIMKKSDKKETFLIGSKQEEETLVSTESSGIKPVSLGSICKVGETKKRIMNKPGETNLVCDVENGQVCVGGMFEEPYGRCLSTLHNFCHTIMDCTQESDICYFNRCLKTDDILFKPCISDNDCVHDINPNKTFTPNNYLKCDEGICKYDIGPLNTGCVKNDDCINSNDDNEIYCVENFNKTYEEYKAELYTVIKPITKTESATIVCMLESSKIKGRYILLIEKKLKSGNALIKYISDLLMEPVPDDGLSQFFNISIGDDGTNYSVQLMIGVDWYTYLSIEELTNIATKANNIKKVNGKVNYCYLLLQGYSTRLTEIMKKVNDNYNIYITNPDKNDTNIKINWVQISETEPNGKKNYYMLPYIDGYVISKDTDENTIEVNIYSEINLTSNYNLYFKEIERSSKFHIINQNGIQTNVCKDKFTFIAEDTELKTSNDIFHFYNLCYYITWLRDNIKHFYGLSEESLLKINGTNFITLYDSGFTTNGGILNYFNNNPSDNKYKLNTLLDTPQPGQPDATVIKKYLDKNDYLKTIGILEFSNFTERLKNVFINFQPLIEDFDSDKCSGGFATNGTMNANYHCLKLSGQPDIDLGGEHVYINTITNSLSKNIKIQILLLLENNTILVKVFSTDNKPISSDMTTSTFKALEEQELYFNTEFGRLTKSYTLKLEKDVKVADIENYNYIKLYNDFKEGLYRYTFNQDYIPIIINNSKYYASLNYKYMHDNNNNNNKSYLDTVLYSNLDNTPTNLIPNSVLHSGDVTLTKDELTNNIYATGFIDKVMPVESETTETCIYINTFKILGSNPTIKFNDFDYSSDIENLIPDGADLTFTNGAHVLTKEGFPDFYSILIDDNSMSFKNLLKNIMTKIYYHIKYNINTMEASAQSSVNYDTIDLNEIDLNDIINKFHDTAAVNIIVDKDETISYDKEDIFTYISLQSVDESKYNIEPINANYTPSADANLTKIKFKNNFEIGNEIGTELKNYLDAWHSGNKDSREKIYDIIPFKYMYEKLQEFIHITLSHLEINTEEPRGITKLSTSLSLFSIKIAIKFGSDYIGTSGVSDATGLFLYNSYNAYYNLIMVYNNDETVSFIRKSDYHYLIQNPDGTLGFSRSIAQDASNPKFTLVKNSHNISTVTIKTYDNKYIHVNNSTDTINTSEINDKFTSLIIQEEQTKTILSDTNIPAHMEIVKWDIGDSPSLSKESEDNYIKASAIIGDNYMLKIIDPGFGYYIGDNIQLKINDKIVSRYSVTLDSVNLMDNDFPYGTSFVNTTINWYKNNETNITSTTINFKLGYDEPQTKYNHNMCMSKLPLGGNITSTQFANMELECMEGSARQLAGSNTKICQNENRAGIASICIKDLAELDQKSCYLSENLEIINFEGTCWFNSYTPTAKKNIIDNTDGNKTIVYNKFDKMHNINGKDRDIECLELEELRKGDDNINHIDRNKLGICSFPILEPNQICLNPEYYNCDPEQNLICSKDTIYEPQKELNRDSDIFTLKTRNIVKFTDPFCQPNFDIYNPPLGYKCMPGLSLHIIDNTCSGSKNTFCTTDDDCFSKTCLKSNDYKYGLWELDLKNGTSFIKKDEFNSNSVDYKYSGKEVVKKFLCDQTGEKNFLYFESKFDNINYSYNGNGFKIIDEPTPDYQIKDILINDTDIYALTLKEIGTCTFFNVFKYLYTDVDNFVTTIGQNIDSGNSFRLHGPSYNLEPKMTINDEKLVIQWDDVETNNAGTSYSFGTSIYGGSFNGESSIKYNNILICDDNYVNNIYNFDDETGKYEYLKNTIRDINYSTHKKDIYHYAFETYDLVNDKLHRLVQNNYDMDIKSSPPGINMNIPQPVVSTKITYDNSGVCVTENRTNYYSSTNNKIDNYIADSRIKANGQFFIIDGKHFSNFDIDYTYEFLTNLMFKDVDDKDNHVSLIKDYNYYIEHTDVIVLTNQKDIELVLNNAHTEIVIGGCVNHVDNYYTNIQHGISRVFTIQKIVDHRISDVEPFNEILILQNHNTIFTRGENISPYGEKEDFTNFRDGRSTKKWGWKLHPTLFYFFVGGVYKLYNASKYMHHDREVNGVSSGGTSYFDYNTIDSDTIKKDYSDLLDYSAQKDKDKVKRYNFFSGKAWKTGINEWNDPYGDNNVTPSEDKFEGSIENTVIGTYNSEEDHFIGGGVKPLDMAQIIDISTLIETSTSGFKTVFSSADGKKLEWEENPLKDVGKYDERYMEYIRGVKRVQGCPTTDNGTLNTNGTLPNDNKNVRILSNIVKGGGLPDYSYPLYDTDQISSLYVVGSRDDIYYTRKVPSIPGTGTDSEGNSCMGLFDISTQLSEQDKEPCKLHATNFYSTTLMNIMSNLQGDRNSSQIYHIFNTYLYDYYDMDNLKKYDGVTFDSRSDYNNGVCIIGYKNRPKHSIIVNNIHVNNCRDLEYDFDIGIDPAPKKVNIDYKDNNYLKYWNIQYNKTFQHDDNYSAAIDSRNNSDSYHVYDGDRSIGPFFDYQSTNNKRKLRRYEFANIRCPLQFSYIYANSHKGSHDTYHSYDITGYNVNNAPAIIANGVHNQVYTAVLRKNNMYLFNLFLDENIEDNDIYPIGEDSSFFPFIDLEIDDVTDKNIKNNNIDDYNKYLRRKYTKMFETNTHGDYNRNKNRLLEPDFYGYKFKYNYVDNNHIGGGTTQTQAGGAPIFMEDNYNTKHFIFKHDYYCFSDLFFSGGFINNSMNIQLNNQYKINDIVQSKIILQSTNITWPSWIEQIKDIMYEKDCYIKKICYVPSKKNILSHLNYLVIVNTYDISLFSDPDKKIVINFPGHEAFDLADGGIEDTIGNVIHDEIKFKDTIDNVSDIEECMFYNGTNNKRFFLKKQLSDSSKHYKLDKFISEEDIYNLYDTSQNKFYIYKPKTLGFLLTRKNGQNFTNNKPIHLPTFKEHYISFNSEKVYILANKCS